MTHRSNHFTLALLSLLLALLLVPSHGIAQDEGDSEESYLLRWAPFELWPSTYMLSTSGTRGESIAVRTENFEIEFVETVGGIFHFVATGEPVPEGARLGLRFQRSLFPEFPFTVDELGRYEVPDGLPFPPFMNIPIFPEEEVSLGVTWSGGPVDIISDPYVGNIPFTFESTLVTVANYLDQKCAVIETDYTLALPEGAQSIVPFLGLVEGDPPEEPGQGAPIGGIVEDSRAHIAGIEPGDFIIEAEGQRIRGWGGLAEILPFLVPEVEVDFKVRRGDEELTISITPEGFPMANVIGSGGLHSTCYFSLEGGAPVKIDIIDEDLEFTLTNADGVAEHRVADIHLVLEFQY